MTSPLRLLSLTCLRAALVAGAGALLAFVAPPDLASPSLLVGAGAALGCAAAGLQVHPRRGLGLAPPGLTALAGLLTWAALTDFPWSWGFCLLLGGTLGVVGAALRAVANLPGATPGSGKFYDELVGFPISEPWFKDLKHAKNDVLCTIILLLVAAFLRDGLLGSPPRALWVSAAVSGVAAVAAWAFLAVPTLELLVAFVLSLMYAVETRGPGAERIPRRGPLLLIANHASYADPFWLTKMAPRKVTPMMTSAYYDLPGIRWLMIHVVGAIRVQTGAFRRETPELDEAVAVLRRGGCVLLFPEGGLRKREETLLGPFGQGVWHILKAAPDAPVVVCWIEGGWGSFASYRDGPPMKNKRLDWRWPIEVAVAEPCVLDPALLADHRATRAYLRRACLECRRWLGLPIPDKPEMKERMADGQGDEAPEADARSINP